jgi:hypothetical protein
MLDTMTDTTTTVTDPSALADLVDGYLACWNTTDPDERQRSIEATWSVEAIMTDPLVDATGHAALAETFAMFHQMYPGHSFRRQGGIDAHHRLARWGWQMVDPSGTVVLDGLDVALLTEDGERLAYVAGFFGSQLPAEAA